jgi:energy-coupling factor transport system ATP-binding protein
MDLLVRSARREGTALGIITHDMDLVAEYADRVIALCSGEVLVEGTPRGVFSQPELLAQTYVEPPLITQLGLRLGVCPPPLSVEELKQRLIGGVA